MTTTQTELRLAKRMSRLGTETAFEVLVRARALERQGKNVIHLEIGEPDMDTPANVVEGLRKQVQENEILLEKTKSKLQQLGCK